MGMGRSMRLPSVPGVMVVSRMLVSGVLRVRGPSVLTEPRATVNRASILSSHSTRTAPGISNSVQCIVYRVHPC